MPIDSNPNPEYKKAMVVVAHPDDAENMGVQEQ